MAPRVGSRKPSSRKPALSVVGGADTASAAAASAAPDAAAAPIGHNAKASKEAAEQAQLISYMSKLGEQQRDVAAAKAVLDEKRAAMTETFRLAKAAGFERAELNSYLKDLGTRSKDLVEAEVRRRRHRVMLGLPVGEEQLSMFGAETPSEARDQMLWRSEGYQAFLRGDDPTPPTHMAARFNQHWLEGYHDGQKATAMSMQMVEQLGKDGGGAHANANNPDAPADDSRPAGYRVEKVGDGYITVDPKDEEFGKPHATEEAAWRACRNDAETIARQNAAVEKAQAQTQAEPAPAAPAAPDSDEV